MNNLISVDHAKKLLLAEFQTKQPVQIATKKGNGLVLAEEIISPIDLPLFNNSSMDGFAVQSFDTINASKENPLILKVIEDIPAGRNPKKPIQSCQTSRIMTGAMLPPNADAIIPVELTSFSDRYNEQILPKTVEVYQSFKIGDNVRTKGMDVIKGEKLFDKGHHLKPHDLGFISGLGIDIIKVYPRPKIALFSSGNEIVKAGKILKPGQIFDINSISILSLLQSFGAIVVDLGTVKDNYERVKNIFDKSVSKDVDLIVSTAGVSMGAYDFVKKVLEDYGQLDFWKVNMRPGKPLTFGKFNKTPFVGLPGNPVSAYVGSRIFVKPIVQKLMGIQTDEELFDTVVNENIESDGRESYLRVLIDYRNGESRANLAKHQGSGNMYSLVCANALLIVPAGVKSLPKGSNAKYIPI